MQEAVSRVLTWVSALVVDGPSGTNLGLLHLFWMMLCGKLLLSRGAIFPGLSAVGLSEGAVRRHGIPPAIRPDLPARPPAREDVFAGTGCCDR